MYKTINKRFFDIFKQPQKKKIIYGGAGSGKSVSIAQHFCLGLISGDGVRRLVLRKYFPSMKVTTLLVIKAILSDWGIQFKEHKTDHYIQVGNNYLFYMGLEDVARLKGGEFKEIWLEEATEFLEEDYKQLSIRLARDKHSEDVTMFLSFNPVDQNHWCVKLLDQARADPNTFLVHHSTYKDNSKNLSKTFMNELESLVNIDENFYRVYTLGEPGVLKNKIYSHFSIEDSTKWPWAQLNCSLHCYGLDFGFNHPMALSEIWFYENEFYIKELYYKTEQTTDDLAIWMHKNGVSHTDYVFADAAEPDRIETLNKSRYIKTKLSDTGEEMSLYVDRFNVMPAKKDVRAGIDFIKSKKIHLCSQAANGIKEYNNYKYRESKDGVVFEEPVKTLDDFLDCARYGCYSLNIYLGLTPPVALSKGSSYERIINPYRKPFQGMDVCTVYNPFK
jgi:phage terminase large subunit